MLPVPCNTVGGLLLKRGGDSMNITLLELVAILELLVNVITLCCLIFFRSKKK